MTLVSSASFGASSNTIELRLGPSWQQAGTLLVMHVGALVFLAPLAIPALAKAFFSLVIVASLLHTLYVHGLRRGRRSLVRLAWLADGSWELEEQSGVRRRAELAGVNYAHPRLVVLNFRYRDGGRGRSVVLTPDSLMGGSLRQLRVLLHLRARR